MRYDERIAFILHILRAAKHGVLLRDLLEKLKIIYPDNKESASRMLRRDIRQFNAEIGHALGYSIYASGRPLRCSLQQRGSEGQ